MRSNYSHKVLTRMSLAATILLNVWTSIIRGEISRLWAFPLSKMQDSLPMSSRGWRRLVSMRRRIVRTAGNRRHQVVALNALAPDTAALLAKRKGGSITKFGAKRMQPQETVKWKRLLNGPKFQHYPPVRRASVDIFLLTFCNE